MHHPGVFTRRVALWPGHAGGHFGAPETWRWRPAPRACAMPECPAPIDCKVTFDAWTACPCNGGTQSHTVTHIVQPKHGGKACPAVGAVFSRKCLGELCKSCKFKVFAEGNRRCQDEYQDMKTSSGRQVAIAGIRLVRMGAAQRAGSL